MGKKLVVFSVFMLLLNLFSPFVNGEKVFAEGQDISARNVTNLTVNPEVMNDGANAKVRVTFDDTGGKIKSGDFIKVDWPSNNQGKIEGFSKTIPLEIRGKKVGEVVINKDGATITFSDNIETFDDASGFAEFEIQGRNYTDTQQEDDKNVTIKSGNTSKVVTIHKGESGTESVFYDKTGDILPEDTSHVRWFLNINNEQKPVSKEIRVNDQIQEGQQLELESLNIRIDGTHSNYFSGPDAIAKFQEYIPGAVITADQDKNTIDVYIPQGYASNNQFTIAYKTKITNEKQKEFINRSQAWYQEHGKEEVNGKSFDYTVQNISGDAGIEGTEKGELKIFKKDKDTKSPISNVKFKLTRADGNVIINNQQEVEIITNNEGIANIKGLPSGKYIVKETEAPAPYQFDKDKTYEFELKDEDNVGYFLEVDNEKKEIKTKDVTAKKVWEDGKTNHPTIFFKLYQKSSDGSVVPVENAEIKKLESGITEVTWENVLESDQEGNKIEYVAQEVNEQGESTVPKGYTKKEEGLTITNTEKELEKTKIAVEKIWDDKNNQDGKRAKEVQVQLYKIVDNKKESVGEVVSLSSENNWSYEWQNLDKLDSNDNVIDYKVEEINTTGGYESSISKVNDNSFAITNTYKPESTKVSGEKVWKDHDNQDGKRPEKVTVNLLANGEKIDSVEVSEQDGWQYEFNQLPKYKDGQEIKYTVTEDHVKDYSTTIDEHTITNEYTPGKTTATVTKQWDDKNNQDGKRPKSIEVALLADGKETGKTITLNESNNWTHTWTDLAEKAKGKTIDYTVKELTEVKGYEVSINNQDMGDLNITNTYKPESTKVSGEKVWKDHDNQDGKRPEKVTVNLLANGEKIDSVEVSEQDGWQYEFNQLPKYKDGQEIKYTVTEDHVKDYSTTIDGHTITNEYTPGKTTATVTKQWDDKNNQDGKRPKSIEVALLADGKETGKTITLNESNNWTHTWTDLAEKAKGKTIDYTVKELTEVKGYEVSINNQDMGDLNITNTYKPESTKVSGEKVWKDHDNQDGKRPEKVTVNLLANGEKIDSVEVSEQDGWQYEFNQLPKYKDGQEIKYTVTEDHVKDYSTTIDGHTITNEYTPGKTTATVTKQWDDKNNQDGKRPKSIEVALLADGKETGKTITLNESNNWTHTWTDLAEKAKGKTIDYTVKELTEVKGYEVSINNQDMGDLNITNTYKPESTKVSGEKVWKDHDNQDGKRPEKVTVNLLANGEKIDSVEVSEQDGWQYEFNQLPKYKDGQEIKYTVTEDHVKDYSTTIDGHTITNEYTPGKTTATVTKQWDDKNNQDGKRPKSIEVALLADGKETGKTITLNESNNWTHTWTDLAEKAKGKTISYSVRENNKKQNYKVTVNDRNIGNMMIINTLIDDQPTPKKPKPNEPNNSNDLNKPKPNDTNKSEHKGQNKDNSSNGLPQTGEAIAKSWITWVAILLLVAGIFLIRRKR